MNLMLTIINVTITHSVFCQYVQEGGSKQRTFTAKRAAFFLENRAKRSTKLMMDILIHYGESVSCFLHVLTFKNFKYVVSAR